MVTLQYFVHRLKKKEASFTLRIKSCQYPLISNIFAIPDKVKADRNESNYCSKKNNNNKTLWLQFRNNYNHRFSHHCNWKRFFQRFDY